MTDYRGFAASHRAELVAFGIGSLLFIGGLVTVFTASRRAPTEVGEERRPALRSPRAKVGRVGPEAGEALAPYFERKRALLRARAARSPGARTFAVVSFDSYRRAKEAEDALASLRLRAHSVQIRIPLPGFEPVTVAVGARSIADAVEGRRRRIVKDLKGELGALEEIIPTVDDPQFKTVYEADAENLRKAISLLESDPSLVFAVVVASTNGSLRRAAEAPGVRLADLPDEPAASPETHEFVGVLPEDVESASWAGPAPGSDFGIKKRGRALSPGPDPSRMSEE